MYFYFRFDGNEFYRILNILSYLLFSLQYAPVPDLLMNNVYTSILS